MNPSVPPAPRKSYRRNNHACSKNSLATVEDLYRKYPDAIDHTTSTGWYPIHYAIRYMGNRDEPASAVEIIRFLLKCNPNQNLFRFQGVSLLRFACRSRRCIMTQIVRLVSKPSSLYTMHTLKRLNIVELRELLPMMDIINECNHSSTGS